MTEEVNYEFEKAISKTDKYQVESAFECISETTDYTTSSNISFDNNLYSQINFNNTQKSVKTITTKYVSQR